VLAEEWGRRVRFLRIWWFRRSPVTRLTLSISGGVVLAGAGVALAVTPSKAPTAYVSASVTVRRAVTTHKHGRLVVRYVPVVKVVRLKARVQTTVEMQTVKTRRGLVVRKVTRLRYVPVEKYVGQTLTATITRNGKTLTVVTTRPGRRESVTVSETVPETVEHTNTQVVTSTTTSVATTQKTVTRSVTETETATESHTVTETTTLPAETTTETVTETVFTTTTKPH